MHFWPQRAGRSSAVCDLRICGRILRRKFANVKGNVKIQRVPPVTPYLYVLSVFAKRLHCCCKVEWHLGLIRADKHNYFKRVDRKNFKILGPNVFKINEYVVGRQLILQDSCSPNAVLC